jgi:hypothetical protein
MASYYGTVADGDIYFGERLGSDAWEEAESADKLKSLKQATRLIDRLNFKGAKNSVSQDTEFPRGADTVVPNSVEFATYEIALMLLDELNLEYERDSLRTSEDRYATVRITRDTSWGPEHLQAGIPSAVAWDYLKPYLRDSKLVNLKRV